MKQELRPCPSANFDDRPNDLTVDMVIIHYTGMVDTATALSRLTDPQSRVSAHYTIDEDGTIYHHVAEEKRAWHAGVASWRGDNRINARSIGIELVNPGHEFGYRPFRAIQIVTLIDLIHNIRNRHPVPDHQILGHSDVAPQRKQDPGELFPWAQLAAAGLGLWPVWGQSQPPHHPTEDLIAIGYDVTDFRASLQAFRQHWHPEWFLDHDDAQSFQRLHIIRRMIDDMQPKEC